MKAVLDSSCDVVEERSGPRFGEDQSFISGGLGQGEMFCWQCYKY